MDSMYSFTPEDIDKINAMPMIPMLPANDVIIVRPFLVRRLFADKESAVQKDIEAFFCFCFFLLIG